MKYNTVTKLLPVQEKYNYFQDIIVSLYVKQVTSSADKFSEISEKTKDLMIERSHLLQVLVKSKENRKRITEVSKMIRVNIRKDRKKRRLETIERTIIKSGGVKKAQKSLLCKKDWIPRIKDTSGKMYTRRPDIMETATGFYKNLYRTSENRSQTELVLTGDESIPDILVREVEWAIESLKEEKASGPDNIPNE